MKKALKPRAQVPFNSDMDERKFKRQCLTLSPNVDVTFTLLCNMQYCMTVKMTISE